MPKFIYAINLQELNYFHTQRDIIQVPQLFKGIREPSAHDWMN